jgi:hypothetical protein
MELDKNIILFKQKVGEYLKEFGLLGFDTKVEVTNRMDVRGSCYVNLINRQLIVYYSASWIVNAEEDEISRVAYHECAEAFLAQINTMLMPHYSKDAISTQLHNIIEYMCNKKFGVIL